MGFLSDLFGSSSVDLQKVHNDAEKAEAEGNSPGIVQRVADSILGDILPGWADSKEVQDAREAGERNASKQKK
jgi:hypothetical protein